MPDPKNTDVRTSGETNPDNFVGHRQAMVRLSLQVPALAAAWTLTKERRYADHAVRHLRAWFINRDTLMNPHLLYGQAIKGHFTGRGIGIIDTLHLVEVARAARVLEAAPAMSAADHAGVREWFARYLTWMTTHQYGIDERNAQNNHGTCWVAQVAEFAHLTGNTELSQYCRDRFKTVLLPTQMAPDGSFPLELAHQALDIRCSTRRVCDRPRHCRRLRQSVEVRIGNGRGCARLESCFVIADKSRGRTNQSRITRLARAPSKSLVCRLARNRRRMSLWKRSTRIRQSRVIRICRPKRCLGSLQPSYAVK